MNKYQEEYLVRLIVIIGDFGLEAGQEWAQDRGLGWMVCEALSKFNKGE